MGSSPINAIVVAAATKGEMFSTLPTRRLCHVCMDENWPLFQPMKLVSISTNGIHSRFKPLPINRLQGT